MDSGNRKLIRPSFNEFKEKGDAPRKSAAAAGQKRQVPPDQTNAENFYYVKQMQSRTPVAVVLTDGEILRQADNDIHYAHWHSAPKGVVSVIDNSLGGQSMDVDGEQDPYLVRRIR